ncbi:MAG: hypothetical protein ACRCZK_03925 [Oscillospiraceae bacterium]
MQVSLLIKNLDDIDGFIMEHPMYSIINDFTIQQGYRISISNNMDDFKSAINLFVQKANEDCTDVNSFDLSNNPIIEVSKIAYDGSILGFDLYLENNYSGGTEQC